MSNLVPGEDIEKIVGHKRHKRVHYGRAITKEKTLYILHPYECLDTRDDLRNCEYSLALDVGIQMDKWQGFTDEAVALYIEDGRVRPLGAPRKESALAAKSARGKGPPSSASWRGRERATEYRSQS